MVETTMLTILLVVIAFATGAYAGILFYRHDPKPKRQQTFLEREQENHRQLLVDLENTRLHFCQRFRSSPEQRN